MLIKPILPIAINDDIITLIPRNNHDFDKDLWLETDLNRQFLRQYLLWVDNTNSFADVQSTSDMFAAKWQDNSTYAYSLILNANNQAIGSIDMHNLDNSNFNAEIGYWLAEEYNGRGLMSRAVKLIEKQGFSAGYHRLHIIAQEDNLPSIHVAERNQYIYEGTLQQTLYKYGKFYNEKIYAKINNS